MIRFLASPLPLPGDGKGQAILGFPQASEIGAMGQSACLMAEFPFYGL